MIEYIFYYLIIGHLISLGLILKNYRNKRKIGHKVDNDFMIFMTPFIWPFQIGRHLYMFKKRKSKSVILNLDSILIDGSTTIYGREIGKEYLNSENILEGIKDGYKFKFIITNKISYINDSFWKGFFDEIFKKYKTKDKVLKSFSFEAKDQDLISIKRNIDILHAIYND